MRTKRILAAVMMLAMAGCAAGAEDQAESASGDEARSTAWQELVGSFTAGADQAEFAAITFEVQADHSGHHYFAESQETLVSCRTGSGCVTSHKREDGYFTATATRVTLHPRGAASRVYRFTKTDGGLVLTRGGANNTYTAVASYCDTAQDCADEGLIHPLCAIGPGGGWQCSAEHACGYLCGGYATGAAEGQTCGGIANIQCQDGLVCAYPNGSGPSYPDEGGTCQQPSTASGAGVGETCGGIAAIQCQDGLVCWYSNGSAPSYPDEGGTCRTAAHRGESCGGFVRFPAVCVDGSECVANVSNPDLPGTCR